MTDHVSTEHEGKKQTKISSLFFTPKKATVHERKKLFECDVCSAEFTDETSLNDNCSKEHEGKKQTKSSSFFTPKNATNVHETKKPFKCDVCSAEFTEFTFLTGHVSTEHEESKHEEGVQICHKCPQLATHFCKTCEIKLCKFCIIKHYQNTNFTKNHEMVPI